MKIIPIDRLMDMNAMAGDVPFHVDLAYTRPDNLLFGERIYRPGARLWLYDDLARVVINAARWVRKNHNLTLVLYDGLRTTDAQEKMLKTKRVIENPHWLQEPRLLSPPGAGGHPRGMAVDVGLMDASGNVLDMGTDFDFLAADPGPEKNPAHRNYKNISAQALKNRNILDSAMMGAAGALNIPLLPLPQEWWDFRLPREIYEQYAPLSDADLPAEMRMV